MKSRFEGRYYKHQAKGRSLAVICGRTGHNAFVQVITDEKSYSIPYPLSEYHIGEALWIGDNRLSASGVVLDIRRPELTLKGEVSYGSLTPIRGDIMGPFRFFTMECRHEIISMKHELTGALELDGERLDFTGGIGYIESDSGRSFPKGYTWVHCNNFERDCSVVAAVARIPFYGFNFWGCICIVHLEGCEYRLATYSGGKILRCELGKMELKQGKYRLALSIGIRDGHMLDAPRSGEMSRIIRERLSCPLQIRFTENDKVLFEGKSESASYEYEI